MSEKHSVQSEFSYPQYQYAEWEPFRYLHEKFGLLTPDGGYPLAVNSEAVRLNKLYQRHASERLSRIESTIKEREVMAKRFLKDQQQITVDMGDLGEQSSRYVILSPHDPLKLAQSKALPPVFLIPGASNDLEGVGMLAHELAFSGRQVIMIGYPESWHGSVTKEFADAVGAKGLGPYADYFQQAIGLIIQQPHFQEQIGEFDNIELWGFSTGAAVSASLLKRKDFNRYVSNAALICPPGLASQKHLLAGVIGEGVGLIHKFPLMSRLNPDAPKTLTKNPRQRELMELTHQNLRKIILSQHPGLYEGLAVRENGRICLVSNKFDFMTNSHRGLKRARQAGLEVIKMVGYHTSPLLEPEKVIEKIYQKRGLVPRWEPTYQPLKEISPDTYFDAYFKMTEESNK